ncbi:hypothetical protein CWE04_11920 [Thomasclavelia cocleata]|uniref:Phage tail protein n=1 Tax=Thomasclavelia cocleata TaxID=69824 RepID=A0A1I0BMF1_9FIRM|nr:phage tail domain-containing protein [Thomasclavelia cocleata]MCR1960191.1 hypothetical protein [Thomasclavelia cocleata]NDO41835.1 hypothetical protein [Thomasclavelia cocleata]PJN79909.1 hypothetical protein CWE04_11920 [Thomasclavelia cocleata]SET07787.1 hypothetical protein SAMN04489758_101175 [Thomasclavelia cocleata]
MKIKDFKYKDKLLSEFDLIMCDPNNNSGNNTVEGVKFVFNTIKMPNSEKYNKTYVSHESPLSAIFGICKRPCDNNKNYFDQYELEDIINWLSGNDYEEFQPCDEEFDDIVFYGSFVKIDFVRHGEHIYKLIVAFETNSSFGYGVERNINFEILSENSTYDIINDSDETGHLSPSLVEIQLKKRGDLLIKNLLNDELDLCIKNCEADEIITFDNEHKILLSSENKHNLYDDFNYCFLKLYKTKSDFVNTLSFSLPCKVNIKYRPLRKVPILCQ